MSWFDTSQLASLATKAMKDAQKTLDKALDIQGEEPEEQDSKWTGWNRMIRTESQHSIKEEGSESGSSVWGSFSGSFFSTDTAAGKGGAEGGGSSHHQPVSRQPKKKRAKIEKIEIERSSLVSHRNQAVPGDPNSVQSECFLGLVDQSQGAALKPNLSESSLMAGCSEEELIQFQQESRVGSSCEFDEFSSTRLEVPHGSAEAPTTVPHSLTTVPQDLTEISSTTEEEAGTRLGQPLSSPTSSIEIVSPSSIELLSPSSVEVINSSSDQSPANRELSCKDFATNQERICDATNQERICDATNQERICDNFADIQVVVNVGDELNCSESSDMTVVMEREEPVDHLENLLSDAMIDNEKKSSDGSSQSSDIAKLECPSETSCDEFENYTSNSSDVEVISSPNSARLQSISRPFSSASDEISSNGQRRHSRNRSDQSVEEHPERARDLQKLIENQKLEMAELRRRNNDLAELVEAREGRILAVSREISQVQEESGQMSVRLEAALRDTDKQREGAELLREERDRLNADLQTKRKEKTELEKQLKRFAKERDQRRGDEDDKDQIISDLRSEGESLAKQNGKQAEIIKKLRAGEKTSQAEAKKLAAEVDRLKAENESSNKSLGERTENETALNKTIRALTDANQAWETETKKLKTDLEDNLEKVNGLRSSLETAYREMAEMKTRLAEAVSEANTEAMAEEVKQRRVAEQLLEVERRAWLVERVELESRLSNVQSALILSERSGSDREETSRRELHVMRLRLEESENRHEDLAESISLASKPLLRQVESLQAALKETQSNADRVEQNLTDRLNQAAAGLAAAQERERVASDQYRIASAKLAALESKAQLSQESRREFDEKIAGLERELEETKIQTEKERAQAALTSQKLKDELLELRRDKEFLSVSLESEKAEGETRRKKSLALMEQLKERDRRVRELQSEIEVKPTRGESVRSSPSPSLSQLSVSGSEFFSRDSWAEDVFHYNSSAVSLYDTVKHGSTAAVVESLQAQLKMREGECVQLQHQIAQSERVRESMEAELTSLTDRAEMTECLEGELEALKERMQQLEAKYQTMLTMYGEKVEEAEELKLDLLDVKEMYKTQIDQLLGISNK